MVSAPPGIALDVGAEPFVPERKTLPALREAVQGCRGCDLYRNATQAVFGEGARHAEVLFVGEQPGDKEDLAGKPFVGPAGQLLDRALEEAGIDRSQTYVTNAVKHFKWQARGKRRIHQKPSWSEVDRVPAVARRRARRRPAERPRLPGCDRGAVPPRPRFPRHAEPWQAARFGPRRARDRNDPPLRDPPAAGRGVPPRRVFGVRRRPAGRRAAARRYGCETVSVKEPEPFTRLT